MNSTKELKKMIVVLDENQLCLLDTMITQVRADHPVEWSNNSQHEEIRAIIKAKIEELF